MLHFAACGFTVEEFRRLGFGPVIRKDELSYFREIGLLERFTVTLTLGGIAPDGSHWILRNDFIRADGKTAATVRSTGGWLDLSARRLIAAPAGLLDAMNGLGRTSDFMERTSSIR